MKIADRVLRHVLTQIDACPAMALMSYCGLPSETYGYDPRMVALKERLRDYTVRDTATPVLNTTDPQAYMSVVPTHTWDESDMTPEDRSYEASQETTQDIDVGAMLTSTYMMV